MSDLAEVALRVLNDRSGFDHWWDMLDRGIQDEIRDELRTELDAAAAERFDRRP